MREFRAMFIGARESRTVSCLMVSAPLMAERCIMIVAQDQSGILPFVGDVRTITWWDENVNPMLYTVVPKKR